MSTTTLEPNKKSATKQSCKKIKKPFTNVSGLVGLTYENKHSRVKRKVEKGNIEAREKR